MNPLWGNPEIHINEYSPQQTNQIPAYKVAWFYHIEKNNVDWANTACWNNFDGITNWSNCNVGLNGLFWYDEQSPLPAYWANRAYVEMQNGIRIFCANSDPKTVALSSKNDALQEMRILVGRYYSIDNGSFLPTDIGKEVANVSITVNNYPNLSNATVPLVIQKIPKGNLQFQNSPLDAPLTVFSGSTVLIGSTINITIPNFLDGDAYYLYLNPSSVLGIDKPEIENNFTFYQNPSETIITFLFKDNEKKKLILLNTLGQIIRQENDIKNSFTIDIADLPLGIYYVKIGNSLKKFIKKYEQNSKNRSSRRQRL